MVLIELFGPIGLALSVFSIRKFGPIIKHSMKNRKKRKRLYEEMVIINYVGGYINDKTMY